MAEGGGGRVKSTVGTLARTLRSNLSSKRVWQELSGSLGDIGTFLPLLLALALVNGVDLGVTLVFTGLFNLITGCMFGVPMPVQPMKSIAAVAIAEGDPLTVPQIMAAGLTTAFVLIFLGVTGLMTVVNYLVPLCVVRGIQLSQGLLFGSTAVKYILKNQNLKTSKSTSDRPWTGLDGLILALSAFVFVILATGSGGGGARSCGGCAVVNKAPTDEESAVEADVDENSETATKQKNVIDATREEESDTESHKRIRSMRSRVMAVIPSALIVFVVGVVISIVRHPSALKSVRLGPSHFAVVKISRRDWRIGFVRAAVPQIPVSILNSVIATCKLSNDLFPDRVVTPLAVSTSVGMMNLVGCWFGSMPVCHGAGGLAGQYKFGARSGLSVAILGAAKLALGLFLGSSLLRLLAQFPIGLLGVLLFFSGLELAMACRDQTSRLDALVMLVVAIVTLGTSNAAKGFGTGMVVWVIVKIHDLYLDPDDHDS